MVLCQSMLNNFGDRDGRVRGGRREEEKGLETMWATCYLSSSTGWSKMSPSMGDVGDEAARSGARRLQAVVVESF